jgi:hypothetical protein
MRGKKNEAENWEKWHVIVVAASVTTRGVKTSGNLR